MAVQTNAVFENPVELFLVSIPQSECTALCDLRAQERGPA